MKVVAMVVRKVASLVVPTVVLSADCSVVRMAVSTAGHSVADWVGCSVGWSAVVKVVVLVAR